MTDALKYRPLGSIALLPLQLLECRQCIIGPGTFMSLSDDFGVFHILILDLSYVFSLEILNLKAFLFSRLFTIIDNLRFLTIEGFLNFLECLDNLARIFLPRRTLSQQIFDFR